MFLQRSRVRRRAVTGMVVVWVCVAHLLILAGLNARTSPELTPDTPVTMRWQVRMVDRFGPNTFAEASAAVTLRATGDVVSSTKRVDPAHASLRGDSWAEGVTIPGQRASAESGPDPADRVHEIPARPVGPWILDEDSLSECSQGCRLKVDLWVSRDGTITQWELMEAQPEGAWATQTLGPLRATPMHAAQRAGQAVDSRLVVEITVDAQAMPGSHPR